MNGVTAGMSLRFTELTFTATTGTLRTAQVNVLQAQPRVSDRQSRQIFAV